MRKLGMAVDAYIVGTNTSSALQKAVAHRVCKAYSDQVDERSGAIWMDR